MGSSGIPSEGDPIALYVASGGKSRVYYFRLRSKGYYSTIAGTVRGRDILESGYGRRINLPGGFAVPFKPTLPELMENFYDRVTQVIYRKDLALIPLLAGVRRGMRVLEVGTGSGFLTTELARIVCPQGVVVTVDVKEDNLEAARRNLGLAGLGGCVSFLKASVGDIAGEEYFDAAFADIPDPWSVMREVHRLLKAGAPFIVFAPTINQLERIARSALGDSGWALYEVVETMERGVEASEESIRPTTKMIGFTGFIVMLRKISG